MKKLLLAVIIAVTTLACGSALAGAASTGLSVSASVTANCTISTTALTFGAYDPLSGSALNGTGTVIVACTKGATGLTIGMDNGSNFGTKRQMASGAERLPYDLFQPPSNTPLAACTFAGTAWTNTGAGLLTLVDAPSKAARTYNVCGTIPAGQDVAAGAYADTVSATINF